MVTEGEFSFTIEIRPVEGSPGWHRARLLRDGRPWPEGATPALLFLDGPELVNRVQSWARELRRAGTEVSVEVSIVR